MVAAERPAVGDAVEVLLVGDDKIPQARILGTVMRREQSGFRVWEAMDSAARRHLRQQLGLQ